jgi:hypothetical protein
MPEKSVVELLYCFSFSQYQTDGKLNNVMEVLHHVQARRVCLRLVDPDLDELMLDHALLTGRLERLRAVVSKCKREGIAAELILPGLLTGRKEDFSRWQNYLKEMYHQAARIPVRRIWADDSLVNRGGPEGGNKISGIKLLRLARTVSRSVFSIRSNVQLGLIAAWPVCYQRCSTNANQIATELAGIKKPMLAQTQMFQSDQDRIGILQAGQNVATAGARLSGENPNGFTFSICRNSFDLLGVIDHYGAGSFHKSAEASQMQINLNALFGLRQIMIDCFDQVGTAPGTENPYLEIHKKYARFLNKLTQLLADVPRQAGVRVVITDKTGTDNCWPLLLWRSGIPVTVVTPDQINDDDDDATYILTGKTPGQLSRKQLDKVFEQGVLLDALAAEVIQKMNRSELLGLKVAGPIPDVLVEIFSDQTFAAPYYGYRVLLKNQLQPRDYRLLQPVHPDVRAVTTLLRKNSLPDTAGIVLFDHRKKNQRAAVLPYSLNLDTYPLLLGTERQRHLYDIFNWLLRHRLSGFVENTPDLVPFLLPDPKRKRILLVLLNVSFDWAVNSRIRLARIPFAVKRVRHLTERGNLEESPGLRLHACLDYHYLQLTPDTAVPPMQMAVLQLEG